MIRKKKIKRVLYPMLITILMFVISLATIILYPQPLFANKLQYRQFNVYSNYMIGNEIQPVLDSVFSLIGKSELYDSSYKVDIFLADNTFFNKVDDKVFGKGPTARPIDNNIVVKVKVDINKSYVYTTFPKPCQQDLVYIIAHEMVHCLQMHRYGILKFNPFRHPVLWKLEGYPEYIARNKSADSNFLLKNEIDSFIQLKHKQSGIWIAPEEGGCDVPDYYFKGRLMTQYLMNVKELNYDQVLKDKRPEEEIYAEMKEWANKK